MTEDRKSFDEYLHVTAVHGEDKQQENRLQYPRKTGLKVKITWLYYNHVLVSEKPILKQFNAQL